MCVCVSREEREKRNERREKKERCEHNNKQSPIADRRSCLALWRPTDRPCPAQQAQAQARVRAAQAQPRASWQPTSATVRQHHRRRHHHARPFWRPSRPWAATWTCGACRPCPRGDAAWRLVNPQGRGRGGCKAERESGGGCGSPFYFCRCSVRLCNSNGSCKMLLDCPPSHSCVAFWRLRAQGFIGTDQ